MMSEKLKCPPVFQHPLCSLGDNVELLPPLGWAFVAKAECMRWRL